MRLCQEDNDGFAFVNPHRVTVPFSSKVVPGIGLRALF